MNSRLPTAITIFLLSIFQNNIKYSTYTLNEQAYKNIPSSINNYKSWYKLINTLTGY